MIYNSIQNNIPGWNGILAAHHIGYLGDGHPHRAIPYNATDPKIIVKKLQLMKSAGITMVIETWQGPWAASCHLDMMLTATACTALGMQFALLLDPGGMKKWAATTTQAVIEQNIITALNDPGTQSVINSSCYHPGKYVLDFGTGANLTNLSKAFPSLTFLGQGTGFSWITIPTITESKARNAASITSLAKQHKNILMQIYSFCSSFDDSGYPLPQGVATQNAFDSNGGVRDYGQSVWGGPARRLESFSGQFMLQQLATIPSTAPIIAVVTWDDYDEMSSGPLEKVLAETQGFVW